MTSEPPAPAEDSATETSERIRYLDEVMAEINKDRPAMTPAPAATSAAPAAAPASTDSPKITVPGITPTK